jgi:hypothetical protein
MRKGNRPGRYGPNVSKEFDNEDYQNTRSFTPMEAASRIKSLGQERTPGQAVQSGSHLLKNLLGRRITGQVAPLLGVVAQVEQLLVDIPLATDVGPFAFFDGSQCRKLLGQTPIVALAHIVGDDFRQRGIG